MTADPDFGEADLADLASRGIAPEEARRQLSLLRHPPRTVELIRPCTIGDGILRISDDEMPALIHLHQEAARAGRLLKFVPASGAATRMFRDVAVPGEGLTTFLSELRRLAFFDDLRETLKKRGLDLDRLAAGGAAPEILDALLGSGGLGYAEAPKALVKIHDYAGESRTALEEHLIEATQLARAADGTCRLHFTASRAEASRLEALVSRVRSRHERKRRARLAVGFSLQSAATDTLALDLEGRPFRDEAGRLLFRPGGHGALLGNLQALRADLVHVKNIDNVAREELAGRGILWRRLLVGALVQLEGELREHLRALARAGRQAVAPAALFARTRLGLDLPDPPPTRQDLEALLERPLRVCGMVKNVGEPGGGPFWVAGTRGRLEIRIVEGSEVDAGSDAQRRIFASSTHFNPVDMVLSLRDAADQAFDLPAFADRDAVILSRRSYQGRDLVALERPGLWNGAMAGWNTVLVEMPGDTFTPVKTFLDLLRVEHQPG